MTPIRNEQKGTRSKVFNTPIRSFVYSRLSACNLVYPGQNRDVREILRNLIGCLGEWKLEKTDFSRNIGQKYENEYYITCSLNSVNLFSTTRSK